MKKIIKNLLLLTCLILSQHSLATETGSQPEQKVLARDRIKHYLTDGASISAGVGARAISLTVRRLETEDTGKLIAQDEDAFFLSYNLKANYFGNSSFGYSWMFNISSFELDRQEVAPKVIEDLGTHVEGNFAYAVPAFFYNLGNRYNGSHFRIGLGLGLGIAEFHGDIVLTESARENDRTDISNGPSNIFFAGGLFIEGQWGYFTFRISTAGPNLEYNGYEIGVSDTSVMLGMTIPVGD